MKNGIKTIIFGIIIESIFKKLLNKENLHKILKIDNNNVNKINNGFYKIMKYMAIFFISWLLLLILIISLIVYIIIK